MRPKRTKLQSNSLCGLSAIAFSNRTKLNSPKNWGNQTQSNIWFPNSWFLQKLMVLKSITSFWRLESTFYTKSYLFGTLRQHIRRVWSSHGSYFGETQSSQNTHGETMDIAVPKFRWVQNLSFKSVTWYCRIMANCEFWYGKYLNRTWYALVANQVHVVSS